MRSGGGRFLSAGLRSTVLPASPPYFSTDLEQLLIARVVQGIGCAAARVTALSVVRDCYSGRRMGKVMSLVMMVFMSVPIIAPSIGQAILLVAGWHWIFAMLLFAGVAMMLWSAMRLPETLTAERRRPMVVAKIVSAYKTALTTRVSVGYTFGTAFIFRRSVLVPGHVAADLRRHIRSR
ncbi:MFS transporter [Roseibium salinum]|nr:MFS transporter [Roseibium salinum]